MRQAGFTLLELLIYSFIVTLFLGTIIVFAYSIVSSGQSILEKTELAENAKFLQQKITWAVVGATGINAPAIGVTASALSLNSAGAGTFVFDTSNGVARLKTGSAAALGLTNHFVTVNSLNFTTYSFSAYSKNTVRVTATLVSGVGTTPATASLDFFVSTQ